jgi:hypothetical protein
MASRNFAKSRTGPEGTDIDVGTIGEKHQASGVFDGWGYLNLHDATRPNLPIIGTCAVDEALDPAFQSGFGILSVHEVKTDSRPGINLAYFSYYNAGFRVAQFGRTGITEVGRFIDEGGNDFWGVALAEDQNGDRIVLASDRDFGLYIFRYTGPIPAP